MHFRLWHAKPPKPRKGSQKATRGVLRGGYRFQCRESLLNCLLHAAHLYPAECARPWAVAGLICSFSNSLRVWDFLQQLPEGQMGLCQDMAPDTQSRRIQSLCFASFIKVSKLVELNLPAKAWAAPHALAIATLNIDLGHNEVLQALSRANFMPCRHP